MQPAWINLIFVAVRKRLIESEKSRNPLWLFDFHRSRAREIKKVATFANWLAPKKGALFSLKFISFSHSAYITFGMIMSFRKPCQMSFRKLISPFTLTSQIRPPPIGRLFIYRDVRELSFIVLGKALWEMACVNGETGTYGLEIETDFDDHPHPLPPFLPSDYKWKP